MEYTSYSEWYNHLKQEASLPKGFQVATGQCRFVPEEKPEAGSLYMNLGLIRMEQPTESFAGVFTRNAFPGWPVIQGRKTLDFPTIGGVLVNNKIANVGVEGGLADTQELARTVQQVFRDDAPFFSLSTGIIGWHLPIQDMKIQINNLPQSLQSVSLLPFAEAIMTTDAWPKVRSAICGTGRIAGVAKGAGMVEPNMATMLAFILTDIDIPRTVCRKLLTIAVEKSFNRICVDGETSTSDSVLLLSSRKEPYCGDDAFLHCLSDVTAKLAEDVVRNGEGCGHVFKTTIKGAPTVKIATDLARAVANAPLTKTAIHGNDPNVGRFLQALGATASRMGIPLNLETMHVEIDGICVYANGSFLLNSKEESHLHQRFLETQLPLPSLNWPCHEKCIKLCIALGPEGESATITGSDLSEQYVKINADYRT